MKKIVGNYGNYMRIYKPTKEATFIMDNDVEWERPGRVGYMPGRMFYHYNYVKLNNPDAFFLKLNYQQDQDESFGGRERHKYGFNSNTKEYKIPDSCKIYDFTGKHPKIMKEHQYFKQNVFNDGEIKYE